MWLALVLWDERPSMRPALIFGIAGAGVFLAWPVWIGPPVLVLPDRWCSPEPRVPARCRVSLPARSAPIVVVAALHAAGRAESVAIVHDRAAPRSRRACRGSAGSSWLLTAVGGVLAVRQRRGRVDSDAAGGRGAPDAAALFLVARVGRADSPYMALKMPHFAIYPMAAAAALAISGAVRAGSRAWRRPRLRRLAEAARCARAWRGCSSSPCGAATAVRFVSAPALCRRSRKTSIAPADGRETTCNPTASSTSCRRTRHRTGCTRPCSATRCSLRQARHPRSSSISDALVRWITGHELSGGDCRSVGGSERSARGPRRARPVRPRRCRPAPRDHGVPGALNAVQGCPRAFHR